MMAASDRRDTTDLTAHTVRIDAHAVDTTPFDLTAARNYTNATCGVNDHPDTPFNDATIVNADTIRYWLVRGRNTCNVGAGTYGDSTLVPDPRDALDTAVPCP